MDGETISLSAEDMAAIDQADDYIRGVIEPHGWTVAYKGHAHSPIRGRHAREAIVRKGGIARIIVWDRGLQTFLTPTDFEGTIWGTFYPESIS